MKAHQAIPLALALALTQACYAITGQTELTVIERVEKGPVTRSVDPQVLEQRLEVRAAQADHLLTIAFFTLDLCDELLSYDVRIHRTTHKTLPDSHWIVAATAVATLAAGITTLAIGLDKRATGEGRDLGTPAQERDYDLGFVLTGVGAALTAAGGLLTISEVADLLYQMDSEGYTSPTLQMERGERVTCGEHPLPNIAFSLSSAQGRVHLHANSQGLATLPLDAAPLSTIISPGTQHIELSCERCESTLIEINAP